MNDQELLTYAAKAAGMETTLLPSLDDPNRPYSRAWELEDSNWNPLENDADAFQLMVKLSIRVLTYVGNCDEYTTVTFDDHDRITLDHNNDALAATRRAIVMAAAEIGKGM